MNPGVKFLSALAAGALIVALVQGCGSDKKNTDNSTDTAAINFTTDVQPILAKTCATSSCHGGSTSPAIDHFTDSTKFKATSSKQQIESGYMPQSPGSWFSTADKTKVLDFLNGK